MDNSLETYSNTIASSYQVSVDEVRQELLRVHSSLLENRADGAGTEEFDDFEYAAGFFLNILDELDWRSARQALAAVEPRALAEHIYVADILSSTLPEQRILIFSRDELADRLQSLNAFLVEEESSLLTTGLPSRPFPQSVRLGWWQSRLYPTKQTRFQCIAVPVEREQMSSELNYWVRCSPIDSLKRTLDLTVERCSFDDADWIEGISSSTAKRLGNLRPVILKIKLAVMNILIQSLRHPSGDLWSRCRDVVFNEISAVDLRFCFDLDQTYCAIPARYRNLEPLTWPLYGYLGPMFEPGGVSNLFELIGHVAKEQTIGTMHHVREALGKHCIVRHGDNVIQSLPERRSAYLHVMGKPLQQPLDKAIEIILGKQKAEQNFWSQFNERVWKETFSAHERRLIAHNDIGQNIVVEGGKYCERCIAFARAVLADHGDPPRGSTSTEELGENVFLDRGVIWKIRFRNCKPFELPKLDGFYYLRPLLMNPGKPFDSTTIYQEKPRKTPDESSRSFTSELEVKNAILTNPPKQRHLSAGKRDTLIDKEAHRQLATSILEMKEDLDRARGNNDQAEVSRLSAEIMDLEQILRKTTRPDGTLKSFADGKNDPHCIRTKVKSAIDRALAKIESHSREAAQHLRNSLKFRDLFSYEPESPTHWKI